MVDLQRGTVAGYEALSRFAGPPDAGPDVWFEAAGRLGLGAELDARVLERVVGLRLGDAKLAVDDAGAGYAGLQHLMLLRPDLVKLDRALVAGCDRDPAKAALIEMLAASPASWTPGSWPRGWSARPSWSR